MHAHVVYGTPTLSELARGAELVVDATIARAALPLVSQHPPLRETVVVARVHEALKGKAPGDPLRFVQHGHGTVHYRDGERVLLFLTRIEQSPELGRTQLANLVSWVSGQETNAHFALDGDGARAELLAHVRETLAADALADPTGRLARRRALTTRALASSSNTVASSALRDLVRAPDAELVGPGDVPTLLDVIEASARPIGHRIGLLAELERRGLVTGAPLWAALVASASPADRAAAVRAAGAHPSPEVTRALLAQLEAEEPRDRTLAPLVALALGTPGNAAAVPPLAELLGSGDKRARGAAVRALGRIHTTGARRALERAAASHPDAATRRRAAAELTLLGAGAAR